MLFTEVRGMVEECNAALARQPELASVCVFAADLKAIRFKALTPQTPIPKPQFQSPNPKIFQQIGGNDCGCGGQVVEGRGGEWGLDGVRIQVFPGFGCCCCCCCCCFCCWCFRCRRCCCCCCWQIGSGGRLIVGRLEQAGGGGGGP